MIGERLLDLRKDAGLTQNQLAEILNINKHSISAYERDKSEPPDEIKIAMAKFFGVSVDYLVGLSDAPQMYDAQKRKLKLPEGFPEEKVDQLLDYADYLASRYRKKE